MMSLNRIKKITIVSILAGALLLQGCTSSSSNPTEQTNSTIDNGKINIEIDQTNHVFVITSNELGEDFRQEGKILTYSYPETTNVYKIFPYDNYQDTFIYNPIKEWKVSSFQATILMLGHKAYKNNKEGKDSLSRAERISVLNSLTRVNVADFKEMDKIKAGYSDAVFADYVVKYTFPATKKDLYEITHFDLKLNYDTVLDDVKDRPLDYYVIRRAINGITVGLPKCVDLWYEKYDSESKIGKQICSEAGKMFYDGTNIYEVHNNANAKENDLEIYLKDQPVMSPEKALNMVATNIYDSLSYSSKIGGKTSVYAVELVYLTVMTSDFGDVDYYNDPIVYWDNDKAYIYPFWVIYKHDNYMSVGEDIAEHKPMLVNAITGEVVICD